MSEQIQAVNVGKLPAMLYALDAQRVLTGGKPVVLRARGRMIFRAVDAAEIARNRLVKDAVVANISLGTDDYDGRPVSTIEITLATNNTQVYQPSTLEKPPTTSEEEGKKPEETAEELKPKTRSEKPRKPRKSAPEKLARKILRSK